MDYEGFRKWLVEQKIYSLEPRSYTLSEWFMKMQAGKIALPRFQREEAWSYSQIQSLVETILLGLPAGALLVLEVRGEEPFVSRALEGATKSGPDMHLLDGQQRLTSLWKAFNNLYDTKRFFISIKEESGEGIPFSIQAQTISKRKDKILPKWVDSPIELFQRGLIPLHILKPVAGSDKLYQDWINEAVEDKDRRLEMYQLCASLIHKISGFRLPYLFLSSETSPGTALSVYIKMNTTSSQLTEFDVVVAQLEEKYDRSLHEFVAETEDALPKRNPMSNLKQWLLFANSYLMRKMPGNDVFLKREHRFADHLQNNLTALQIGAIETTNFLSDYRILDEQRLPTDTIMPLLIAIWAEVYQDIDKKGLAREVLRSYIWRAFFTERYDKSANTRAFQDFKELMDVISKTKKQSELIMFSEKDNPLITVEDITDAGWPKKRDKLARGLLLISLQQGGNDLADGSPVSADNIAAREYHHIFPDDYLRKELKISDEQRIYTALNCAFTTVRLK